MTNVNKGPGAKPALNPNIMPVRRKFQDDVIKNNS